MSLVEEDGPHDFAVVDIHLTAIGLNVKVEAPPK